MQLELVPTERVVLEKTASSNLVDSFYAKGNFNLVLDVFDGDRAAVLEQNAGQWRITCQEAHRIFMRVE